MKWTFGLCAFLFAAAAHAQWLNYPTPGVPRTADGKPNLSAPAPKTADGKPDLSGVWLTRGGLHREYREGPEAGRGFLPAVGGRPCTSTALGTEGKEDPQAYCVLSGVPREHVVPYPFKILNTKGEIVILYEALHSYRQIFMDGRALPKDPNPAWMGYSIGHWEGDTLVVESSGFVDNNWLDNSGHMGTEALRLTERFHRRDFGHIDLQLTIDDPKAYTKPWTVNLQFTCGPDTELIEYVCDENEKDLKHLVGK